MTLVAVSCRVDTVDYPNNTERRDALDQNWFEFLKRCEITPLIVPNNISILEHYLADFPIDGVLLTGGNSPVKYGGDAPERDEVEDRLISWAEQSSIPVIGVCRGMQSIQMYYKQQLEQIEGHVTPQMDVEVEGVVRMVNSYHNIGTKACNKPLQVWAQSEDGIVKAIKHQSKALYGIMWHPERLTPFSDDDISFFKKVMKK